VRCEIDSDQQLVSADVKKRVSVLDNRLPRKYFAVELSGYFSYTLGSYSSNRSVRVVNPKAFILIVILSGLLCCLNYFYLIIFYINRSQIILLYVRLYNYALMLGLLYESESGRLPEPSDSVMSSVGPGTKEHCAGEGQQQVISQSVKRQSWRVIQ
jgi:hypothetical protein